MSLQKSVSGIIWKKIMSRDVSNVDVICNCCSARVFRKIKVNDSERKKASHIEETFIIPCNETKQTLKSPKSISLEIASTPRSHKYCVVCKQDGSRRNYLLSIPQTASTQAIFKTRVLVISQSRCRIRIFQQRSLGIISSTHRDHSYFSKGDVCRLLNVIRHMMTNGYSQLIFDNPFFLSNDEYVSLSIKISLIK